jgi:hypothetical protein
MKLKILTILMLCGVIGGYAQNTPPHAASTQTWTFGTQTWSDAIHIPECNKADFTNSDTEPQCRSYTEEEKTFYYYNWAYVNVNATVMCPSPWRVPSKADFGKRVSTPHKNPSGDVWVYGGYIQGSSVNEVSTSAYYWSSTETGSNYAHSLLCYGGYVRPQDTTYKTNGFQVRCVR